jgi:hypothetical protein
LPNFAGLTIISLIQNSGGGRLVPSRPFGAFFYSSHFWPKLIKGRTMSDSMLRSKVEKVLDRLPPDGQEELAKFLDFLADKYHVEQQGKMIALEGIWKDISLEITDEDVRKLREDISKQVLKKF